MGVELDADRDAHQQLRLAGDYLGSSVALSSDGTTALIGADRREQLHGRGVRVPRLGGGLVGVELDADRDADQQLGSIE